jgi:hypothetical protein
MWETVTGEQLARMLPGVPVEDLERVLRLCQSAEGDRLLRECLAACDCLAGSIFCTCGAVENPASADLLEQLAEAYRAGR